MVDKANKWYVWIMLRIFNNSKLNFSKAIKKNYIWLGKYDNFEKATKYANEFNSLGKELSQEGFNSKQWISRQIDMFHVAQNSGIPRCSTILRNLGGEKDLQLFDLGGGSGWLWASILSNYNTQSWHYYNLELETTKINFQELTDRLANYNWVTDLKKLKIRNTRRILYSNSCIQYFENNDILHQIIKYISPGDIIFDDLMATDKLDSFSLQNYYGFLQVNRFIALPNLISNLNQLGYDLVSKESYPVTFNKKMRAKIKVTNYSAANAPTSWTIKFKKREEA